MRTLAIMRHAKSSWDDPALEDHERPLAPRGRDAAPRVDRHLAGRGLRPEVVLCSSARRTTETLALLEATTTGAQAHVEDALYHASAATLLERVRALPDHVTSALLIGHNPACQGLVLELAGRGRRLAEARAKLPTAAVALLTLPGDWAEAGPGSATLDDLVLPRELSSP